MADAPRRGRPRSEASRQAVLEAASELVARDGYEALTIEAIAERAGVGRQTIYRWWSSKAAILGEAVTDGPLGGFFAAPDGLDTAALVATSIATLRDPQAATLVRALSAAAAGDAAQSDTLYERGTRASHAAFASAIRRDQAAGVIRADVDPDAAADALVGATLYRVLARLPLPDDYAERLLAPLLDRHSLSSQDLDRRL
jgi:AcrR family transcriptional regulator